MNSLVANGHSHVQSAQLLPAGTAAKRLGVCRKTVTRWCASGVFPGAIRTEGGHWRIPRADLERRAPPRARPRAPHGA